MMNTNATATITQLREAQTRVQALAPYRRAVGEQLAAKAVTMRALLRDMHPYVHDRPDTLPSACTATAMCSPSIAAKHPVLLQRLQEIERLAITIDNQMRAWVLLGYLVEAEAAPFLQMGLPHKARRGLRGALLDDWVAGVFDTCYPPDGDNFDFDEGILNAVASDIEAADTAMASTISEVAELLGEPPAGVSDAQVSGH